MAGEHIGLPAYVLGSAPGDPLTIVNFAPPPAIGAAAVPQQAAYATTILARQSSEWPLTAAAWSALHAHALPREPVYLSDDDAAAAAAA